MLTDKILETSEVVEADLRMKASGSLCVCGSSDTGENINS